MRNQMEAAPAATSKTREAMMEPQGHPVKAVADTFRRGNYPMCIKEN
jgi:hypothetical protein